MQHNPVHVCYMSRHTPVVLPCMDMTSQWFGLQCTHECTTLPSLLPLALPCMLTGHCTVSLWVWLAVHTHKGAKHNPAHPHWPTLHTHRTLHGVPVGLASHHMHTRVLNTAQPAPISLAFACTQHCMAPLWVWLAVWACNGPQHCPAPLWVGFSHLWGHHSCPSTYCCISLHSTLNKQLIALLLTHPVCMHNIGHNLIYTLMIDLMKKIKVAEFKNGFFIGVFYTNK